jgi:hypothetical protein
MCDYSLYYASTRPAVVGDKLKVHSFGTTTAFAAEDDSGTAVCLLPGTEVAFAAPIQSYETVGCDDGRSPGWYKTEKVTTHQSAVARFRQINVDKPLQHHDALEIPSGEVILLTLLTVNQLATVLQLPAAPKTIQEAKEQERVPVFNELSLSDS